MLTPAGIYLLDFESLAFIWVGKDVPKDVRTKAFSLASKALIAVNCKGKSRLNMMSLNLVFYGYEPEVFKMAFRQKWERLAQPGLGKKAVIAEEAEDEDDDDSNQINTS